MTSWRMIAFHDRAEVMAYVYRFILRYIFVSFIFILRYIFVSFIYLYDENNI